MFTSLQRQGKVLVLVCAISLVTIWTYRLPRLCIFDQCPYSPAAIVPCSSTFGHHHQSNGTDLDLSAPDAPFVAWPLARVCSENKRWTPGLVFICDNNSGGIGNIRNFILTCLRYAIEAGAAGLALPTIQSRSAAKLADLFVGDRLPFAYFFDEAHFRRGLAEACPQITVYADDLHDVPGLDPEDLHGGRVRPEQITPSHFGLRGGCDVRDLNRHGGLFGERFHASLRESEEEQQQRPGPASASRPRPRLVRMNWGVQWNWPVLQDGPEFAASFGGLLRFRDDILSLGERTADAMQKLASSSSSTPDGDGRGFFVGIHLRTESDALRTWPSFGNQTAAYLSRVGRLDRQPPGHAYLATGNATEAARLAALAEAQQGLRVVTKHELLRLSGGGGADDELLRQLDALSWDQQALVDFVVLLRCGFFLGVSPSSFSMNVALKRHLREDGLLTRPWRIGDGEGDGRSWLVGRYDSYWEDWLFMYDSLWP
ncbi:putative alternative oxidase [Diaporthe ampelina]|uniref:Putative alternative oxidase n=1 Tax=Diaporthe ampelina TaxID=1214573 RepID=A0A0G2FTB5_9PEZI|nr:putative alternative oxidase [Diaporthe ampelina]